MALKKWFIMKPILVALDLDNKMKMKVDISDYATGESFINGVYRWKIETSGLPFQVIE